MSNHPFIITSFFALILAILACNLPSGQITPTSIGTSSISGMIWHDLCALPEGPLPDPLPTGCIPINGGGASANGILDAGEPGISNVTVQLHSGSCADPVTATALTDGTGQFTFTGLPAKSYCVTVDAGIEPNIGILLPGKWTQPVSAESRAQIAISLQENTTLTNQNFGWDYQFLPELPATPSTPTTASTLTPASPTATVVTTPTFTVDIAANCRSGPGTVYSVISSFTVGTSLKLLGHNDASTWWYVEVNPASNCWISGTVGHTSGNTTTLPVVPAPPTPVPTNTSPPPSSDITPPTLSDPVSVYTDLYYPTTNCASNVLSVVIRASDVESALKSVWLRYRYTGSGGYVGTWHTVAPNDSASGGQYGFTYPIAAEAAVELGTQDGSIEYQFFAQDNAGNTSAYPESSVLGIPVWYCP